MKLLFLGLILLVTVLPLRAQHTINYTNGENSTVTISTTAPNNPTTLSTAVGMATQSGTIIGSGSLTISGTGILALTNTSNSYSGGTTINGGTLEVGADGNLGTGNLTLQGGNLQLVGESIFSTSKNITLNAGTNSFTGADAGLFSGTISGTGALTVGDGTNGSTILLLGTNTYTGGTTIMSNATLYLGNMGPGSIVGNVIDNGTLVFNPAATATVTFGGNISGSGSLDAGGTTILTGTIALTGSGSVNVGAGATLQIGTGGTTGSVSGFIGIGEGGPGGTLAYDRSDTVTLGTGFYNDGTLTQMGSGTLILNENAEMSPTGDFVVSNGTMQFGNGGTSPTFFPTSGSLGGTILDNSAVVFNHTDTFTVSGVISGTGSLTQMGSGTLILTGTNTYNGGTTISGGIVQVSADNNLGSGNLTLQGGELQIANSHFFSTNKNITLNAGTNTLTSLTGTQGFVSAGFLGTISGTGGLTVGDGTNVVTITLGGTDTYTGGTTILPNATLEVGLGSNTGSIVGNVIDNGGFLFDLTGTTTFAGTISGTGEFGVEIGTTILTGTNTFSGTSVVGGGASPSTLQIGNGGTTGSLSGTIVTTSGTLVFDHSDTLTVSGTILNFGTLIQMGSGTTILTGTNTSSGNTIISAGTLQGNATSLQGNILDNAALVFDQAGTGTFAGAISGSGSVKKQNTGTLILTATNAYTGTTTISAGTLQIGNGSTGTIDSTGSVTIGSSGQLAFDETNGSTFSKAMTDGGNVVGAEGSGITNTLSGSISGTGGFIQNGAGTTILSGSNTYSGGTVFNAGTVSITSATNLGPSTSSTGTLTFNGGTLQTSGVLGIGNKVVFNSGGATFDITSGSVALNSPVSGVGPLTVTGGGTLTMNTGGASYTYGGGTTVTGNSTVVFGSLTFLGITGTVTLDSGTLVAPSASLTSMTNSVILNAGGGSINVTPGMLVDSGIITGMGGLTITAGGTLILSNSSNSYSGGTTIKSGASLIADATHALGDSSGSLNLNGGTLIMDFADTLNGSVTLNASSIINLNSVTVTETGTITGSGALIVSGSGGTTAGTLIISNPVNTYSGGTTINNRATVSIASGSALSSGTLTIASGSTLTTTAGMTLNNDIQVGTSTFLNINTGTVTENGLISGGGFVLNGPGILALTNSSNTFNGATIQGTLSVASAGALGNGAGTLVMSGGTLQATAGFTMTNPISLGSASTFNVTADMVTETGTINGVGSLIVTGPGTLVLDPTAANTYSGGTTVNAATLQFAKTNGMSSTGSITISNGGTLIVNAGGAGEFTNATSGVGSLGSVFSATTFNSGTTFAIDITNASSGLTYAGNITNAGMGLTKLGATTLTLTGTNTYTGTTVVSAGTLQIGNGTTGSISASSPVVAAVSTSLTFDMVNGGTFSNAITDNGTIKGFEGSGATNTLSGSITGTGRFIQLGAGTTVLSGTNTYSGGTTITSGTLSISADNNLGAASGSVAINGGTLQNTSFFISTRDVSIGASGAAMGGSGFLTINGTMSGSGSLTKIGSNLLTLGGAVTYTGATVISAGSFKLTANGSVPSTFDSSSIDIVNSGSNMFFTDSQSYAGAIFGAGTLQRQFPGTTILTGAATQTGGTIIGISGTLQIGNGGTTGSLTGTVTDNGTLAFDRSDNITFAGNITDNGGVSGAGSVAQLGSGILTLSGTNAYSGGTTVSNGTLIFNGNLGSGGISLATGGTLQYTGSSSGTMTQSITVTSGIGEVTNTGTSTLALNGTITKTDAIFSVTGNVNINGVIQGTSGSYDSDVDYNHATSTISTQGTYFGATHIFNTSTVTNGINEALPSTVGAASANTTLILGDASETSGQTNIYALGSFTQTLAGITSTTGAGTDSNQIIGGSATTSALTLNIDSGNDTYSGFLGSGVAGPSNANNLSVTKTGTGTLELTSANTYTGGTTVSTGTLVISNTTGSATGTKGVNLSSGATLTGTGTIASSTANMFNGIIAAGASGTASSTGSMTITGASTFGSSANLVFNLNDISVGGAHNEINVGGSAVSFLAGATLTLNLLNSDTIAFTPGQQYVLLAGSAGATYTGVSNINLTLPGLASNGAANSTYYANSFLIVTGNNLDIEIVPEPGTWVLTIGGFALLLVYHRTRRSQYF